ncbi:DUF6895 family protein [Streptomyces sp. NPDC056061]|uniref:DUF6895 family protein n=1 Tax=Streptomyces sp. NPDC056061 TaxID=3345700 RepID=UPI0035DE18A6
MSGASGAEDTDWPELPAHGGHPVAPPEEEGEAARRVLTGALRWIEAHLEWFAPRRWEEFLPRRPFRPGPLLELLGLIRVLDRSGIVPVTASLPGRALDLAEQAVGEPEFVRGLHRGDGFFPYHLNLTALLELLGRPHPALRAACQALLEADAGGHCRPYKPVLSRIELRYFVDRGGFTAPDLLPGIGPLYRQSVAATGADVLQLTASETYALTHALFYATDFGHRRLLPCRSGAVSEVRETVRVLLGVHLARSSLDLLAELLLCDEALDDGGEGGSAGDGAGASAGEGGGASGGEGEGAGAGADEGKGAGEDGRGRTGEGGDGREFRPGAWRRAGWHALAAAQRVDGAVPGPVHRTRVLGGLTGDKATAYLFGTCYHTTLASALAAAARRPDAASRDVPRQVSGPAAGRLPGPVGFPLPRARPEEVRRWARRAADAAGSAPAAVRAELAACLDPLLVLAVQAHDPEVLAEVLRAAERLGRGDGATVRSAAALLAARSHAGTG